MDDKHTWWAWAVKNSVCALCWTTLAIHFKHWWIALFGVFFMSSLETKQNPANRRDYYFICDCCGGHSPEGRTHDEAEHRRIESGWIRRKRGDIWEDICPACQHKNNIH